MFQRFTHLNWRYAAAEVGLIFVGITAAIAFDEWRAEQARQDLEHELLIEIRADLLETRRDLETDLRRLEAQLDAEQRISEALTSGEPYDRATRDLVFTSSVAGALFPKVSGYRALLSHGLDVISDAELRTAITDLHELALTRIAALEASVATQSEPYMDALTPHLQARVDLRWPDEDSNSRGFVFSEALAISDWQALVADEPVHVRLLLMHGPRLGARTMYTRARDEIDAVIERIDAVIGNVAPTSSAGDADA